MALYSRIHVWVTNEILTASDLNNEFNNILNNATSAQLVGYSSTVSQMQQTADPGGLGTESLAGSASDELQRLRFTIKRVAGSSQWYVAPVGNLGTGGIVTANYAAGSVDTAALADDAVTTAKILDGAVTPAKLYLNSTLSGSCSAFSASTTTPVDVTGLSVSPTLTGRPVMAVLVPTAGINNSFIGATGSSGASVVSYFAILRDAVIIASTELSYTGAISTPTIRGLPGALAVYDAPAAGTYNYKVQAWTVSGSTVYVNYCNLLVYEL